MLDSTHGHHHRPDVPPALLMFVVSLLFLSHPSDSASAQEEGGSQGYTAVTIADPKVPTDHLQLMLRSLTKDELTVEADAWLGLLKAKIKEITDAELQRKRSGGAEAVLRRRAW